jgi:hypothetical protein
MLELEHGFRVVDTHLRLEPDETRRPRDIGDPEQVERELRQAGIVEALAVPAEREEYTGVNNAVARIAVDRPLVAAARITGVRDPSTGPTARLRNVSRSRTDRHTDPTEIEQYAYEDRFVAFALDPTVDGLPDEAVLAALERVDLPILTYGGRGFPPRRIERTLLAREFPVVIAHFGGYPLDRELTAAAVDLLAEHERCFLDTSFVRFRDPLERAVIEHPDRVLFASGAPASHPNVAVMEILTLDVTEDAMRRVFSTNAARVLPALAP